MKYVFASALALLAVVLMLGSTSVGGEKVTIKEIMTKAMKGGLVTKVASGKASDEEKKELVRLFDYLHKNTPPKGEEASWKEKTNALLDAAKKGDGKALKAAANCAGCHKVHK